MTEIKPWQDRVKPGAFTGVKMEAMLAEIAEHRSQRCVHSAQIAARDSVIHNLRARLAQQAEMVEKCMVAMNENADRGMKAEQERDELFRAALAKSQPVEQKKCGNTSCAKTDANGGVHDCWYPDCLTEVKPTAPTAAAVLPNGATASNVYEAYAEGLKAGAQPFVKD